MPPLRIQPARGSDCQPIAEMSRDCIESGLPWTWTPARVMRHLLHPESVVLTACSGDALLGFAIMHFGDDSSHLNLLAVQPAYRRLGIGRRLLEWLEESAVVAGTFTIRLEVRARNPGAVLFYHRLGYVETGRIARYYGGREDAVTMAHELRDADAASSPSPVWLPERRRDRRPGSVERREDAGLPARRAVGEPSPQRTTAWLLARFRR